ncbi:MAG: hypothetical protein V1649_03330 [Patescibacteria group bacterium]
MDEEIKKLLEQNLKLTEEIYSMTKKIQGHLTFQKLVSVFYLIMIIAPIILGIIYLPSLMGNVVDQYKGALDINFGDKANPLDSLLKNSASGLNANNIDATKLPDQIKNLFKK